MATINENGQQQLQKTTSQGTGQFVQKPVICRICNEGYGLLISRSVAILVKNLQLNPADFKGDLALPSFDMPVTVYRYGLDKTADIVLKYGLIEKKPDVAALVEPRFAKVIDKPY